MKTLKEQNKTSPINQLLKIMAQLRDPKTGCPWDIEQTYQSLVPYTLEEAYEVVDAIERGTPAALESELGDLLLQVVFHSQIAAERGDFDFDSVAQNVADKMIRRHPHIFGDESRDKTAAQQILDWEAIKTAERAAKGEGESKKLPSTLDGIAVALPALIRAEKIQGRAARVGFDWSESSQVMDKLNEEIGELKTAIDSKDKEAQTEELGDVFFTLVNIARHLGLDSEATLRQANAKFTTRFQAMETALQNTGETLADKNPQELDALWQKAKQAGKKA